MNRLRVAILHGGRSGEHEISLRSARAIMDSLDPARFEVLPFFIGKDGKWDPYPLKPEPGAHPEIDVVFPVLHGTFGEDGTMQGLLELAALPYVGGGVFASSAAMDKDHFKRICQAHGLPVVEGVTLTAPDLALDAVLERLEFPLFVKPCNLGSSVGVAKARDRAALEAAVANAARYDHKVLIERAVTGQEIECAVLGNDAPVASTPCEILPSQEFYDYDDKYLLDQAQTELPARLPPETMEEIRHLAVACYRAIGCAGLARVDFFVETGTGRIYINELNTLPGFTSISMYPKMWAHDGLGFAALVERLIELALDRHQKRGTLRFER
jgi:D-alanine-D-alanine ligase